MSRFLRVAVAWLLALAIPVQGYAAQAVAMGGAAHLAVVTATLHVHAADASSGAEARADMACCDEADANSAAHGSAMHGKCSSCASSCCAAAITTSAVSTAVVPHAMPLVAIVAVALDHLLTGGIERPPRRSLA